MTHPDPSSRWQANRGRVAIIRVSIIGDYALGLFGGLIFFMLVNPGLSVGTQARVGESLFSAFILAPACAAASDYIAARATRNHE
jgi:hypothetical protein